MKQISVGAGAAGFNFLPVFLAQHHGLFARKGLEVVVKRTGTTDKATAALLSGGLDIAITPPEGAIANFAAGGPLRIVGGNLNSLPLSLIAQPRFKAISELRGATLGTSSMTEGTALYTMEILADHGLEYPGDYTFSLVGVHTARWEALKAGTLDAAVQLIPLNFVGQDAGFSNLAEAYQYLPEIAFISILVENQWAKANASHLVDFLHAVKEATELVYDRKEDNTALALLQEVVKAETSAVERSLELIRRRRMMPTDLAVSATALATSLRLMRKANLLPEQTLLDPSRVIDDTYRQEMRFR